MKFLVQQTIDLDQLFNSDRIITIPRRIRSRKTKLDTYIDQPVNINTLIKYKPYCAFIIDQLNNYDIKYEYEYYRNLNSKALDKLINSHRRLTAIAILKATGILIENPKYSTGKFSKSFRIADQYQTTEFNEIELDIKINNDSKMLSIDYYKTLIIGTNGSIEKTNNQYMYSHIHNKAINNISNDNNINNDNKPHTYHLYSHIDNKALINSNDKNPHTYHLYSHTYQGCSMLKIGIDKQQALKYLDDQLFNKEIGIEQYNTIHNQINRIVKKDLILHVGKTGRISTVLNGMSKEYRSFLRDTNGNELLECDFKSSHILHLIKVLSNDLVNNAVHPDIDKERLKHEINEIQDLVTNSDFYTSIQDQYFIDHNKRISRQQAKGYILKVWLNGGYKNWTKINNWINGLYPEISKVLLSTSKLTSRIMSSEAHLINSIIVERLATEYPDSLAFTIYDSIAIEENYVDDLYRIMNDESFNYFGFYPTIELKELVTI